jgi:hypothetical protein
MRSVKFLIYICILKLCRTADDKKKTFVGLIHN